MKANRKFIEENNEAVSAVIGVILMVAITVAIAATVYYYVTVLTGGTAGASSPTMAWSVNAASDKIIITKCTPSDTTYASTASAANLKFTNSTGEAYVFATTLNITTSQSGLEIGTINAGHEITGFADGTTYTVVWIPTNEVLGSFAV